MYCSLESVQEISDPKEGIPAIVKALRVEISFSNRVKQSPFAENADYSNHTVLLRESLFHFCIKLDKPLVILFDEVDCLTNGTLISFLRQLREGYVNRQRIPFGPYPLRWNRLLTTYIPLAPFFKGEF